MEVYDIDKLISLLNQQKERGLYYISPWDIDKMLKESMCVPHEITNAEGIIKRLEMYNSKKQ